MCTWPGTLPDSATAGQRDLFYRGLRVSLAVSAYVCVSIQVIVKKRMSSSASLGNLNNISQITAVRRNHAM